MTTARSQQHYALEGEVLDQENRPLTSVLVRLYRGPVKIGEGRTTADGRYIIPFDSGATVSTLRYDLTGYIVGTINDLSGVRNHIINKVMLREGSRLSLLEALESLSALERVYYIDTYKATSTAAVIERYRETVKSISLWPGIIGAPEHLRDRLKQIRTLYGLDER